MGAPCELPDFALRPLRLAIAGGGTGGHVVPGRHLLDVLHAAGHQLQDLVWFHGGRAAEERCLREIDQHPALAAFERLVLPIEPEAGGAPTLARLSRRMLPAFLTARAALARHRSEGLLGLGGYTTAPAVLAARSLRLPVILLEVNATAGRATRALAPVCQRVLHSWRETLPHDREGMKHHLIGPPLGPSFAPPAEPELARREAKEDLGFDPERPLLVVLGGSQGARGLNEFVRHHVSTLLGSGVQILHQVGPGRRAEGAADLAGYGLVEFIDDVQAALVAADFVLCRGGASTLAEVGAVATPAWVVPYPHHADRHQERNARQLDGGVRVVDEADLDRSRCEELVRLLGPDGAAERARMRQRLLTALPRDSAARIWRELDLLRR
ncbi:MAG: UDP-N-acetylglucosamine--N-acetylmuramyl-(pentapeptide) pyrophosphoryl-undecaprenol N-acetylglucosamine transferase [Planctomycetota bacterium]